MGAIQSFLYKLIRRNDSTEARVYPHWVGVWVLGRVLSKRNLQKLHATVEPDQLLALAGHLTKSPTAGHVLQDLALILVGYGVGGGLDGRAAAQAIGALHGLKKLALEFADKYYNAEPFLWALSQSSPLMLQDFRLILPERTFLTQDVAGALASFLTSSSRLQNVELSIHGGYWEPIATALQTNPTIESFGLYNAVFSRDATTTFLNRMRSDEHAIRNMRLRNCQFRTYPQTVGVDVANMLCGAQLEHIELDHGVLSPRQIASFFTVLSVNASTVRLQTMTLELLFDCAMPHPVEYVAPFVASTVHLESLTIQVVTHRLSDEEQLLSLPVTGLITSMKSNASLCEVKVIRKRDQQPAIRADAWHRIEAFATRNRMLQAGLLSAAPEALRSSNGGPVLLALCQVAMQTTHRPDHEKVFMVMSFLATV
jgi:hypothetical protein